MLLFELKGDNELSEFCLSSFFATRPSLSILLSVHVLISVGFYLVFRFSPVWGGGTTLDFLSTYSYDIISSDIISRVMKLSPDLYLYCAQVLSVVLIFAVSVTVLLLFLLCLAVVYCCFVPSDDDQNYASFISGLLVLLDVCIMFALVSFFFLWYALQISSLYL